MTDAPRPAPTEGEVPQDGALNAQADQEDRRTAVRAELQGDLDLPAQADEPQQETATERLAPEQAQAELREIRMRRREINRSLNELPEPSGRFTQPEAQVLTGYAERVSSQVYNPNVGFGNRSARRLADGLMGSAAVNEFRTQDTARSATLELGRSGVLVKNAQERLSLREGQLSALENLGEEIAYHRDRNNVNVMVNSLSGTEEQVPQDLHGRRRTHEEWSRVIEHEKDVLRGAVERNQITEQELEDYITLREIQRDSLASTDLRGNVKNVSDLKNPGSLQSYQRLNDTTGGSLFGKVQEIIGAENQISISGNDLRELRRTIANAEVMGPLGRGRRERTVQTQGIGTEQVTTGPENEHIAAMLTRVVGMLDGLEAQSLASIDRQGDNVNIGQALDGDETYRISLNVEGDVALTEVGNAWDYINDTAIPQARTRLQNEEERFSALIAEIEANANPDLRLNLQNELGELDAREAELNDMINNPDNTVAAEREENQEEDPAIAELRAQNEQLMQMMQEMVDREEARKKRRNKIIAFAVGAAVGVGAAVVGVPALAVGAIAIVGGIGVAGGKLISNRNVNYLQSDEARETLGEEEAQRRLTKWQKISNVVDYVGMGLLGFGFGYSATSIVQWWRGLSAPVGTGAEQTLGSNSGMAPPGSEGAAQIGTSAPEVISSGSEVVAGSGDSRWSMIGRLLESKFPNLSSQQIQNATANILNESGGTSTGLYQQVYAHRAAGSGLGPAIQVGDVLTLGDLTQAAPNVMSSLAP